MPYGVYDLTTDAGWLSVGTDHDTAAFAVESIRRWSKAAGQTEYDDYDQAAGLPIRSASRAPAGPGSAIRR